jgi:hypothetical protein
MRALPQRLGANGSKAGLDSLTVPPDRGEPPAHRFEGMEPQVMVPLSMYYNPVVLIPIRQQVCGQNRQRLHIEDVFAPIRAVEHTVSGRYGLLQVNGYPGCQTKLLRGGDN